MLAVAAMVCVLTDSRLLTFVDSIVGGPWLSICITVLWIVVITNAFNFLDNMDGLSAGVGVICATFFLATALVGDTPQWFIAATLSLLIGALLGFLLFNFPFRPRTEDRNRGRVTGGASIFMGDSGSLVVGFLLAVLSVRITYVPKSFWSHYTPALPESVGVPGQSPVPWPVFLVPLAILAIPLYDFTSVCLIRLSQGKSPFVGDLQHFSHRLVGHGLSTRSAVLVIYGCTAITGIGAIAIPHLAPWQAGLVGVQTLLVLGVLALYEWTRVPGRG
jgi:UDP-GlcNAc:undecaprenyl-phosphate GlcNAc-1-phosphate transferase